MEETSNEAMRENRREYRELPPSPQRGIGAKRALFEGVEAREAAHGVGDGAEEAQARLGEADVLVFSANHPSFSRVPFMTALHGFADGGKGVVIHDLHAHVKAGGAYYECDPAVRSEACLPIFARDGSVCGIVDAEHSTVGAFDEEAERFRHIKADQFEQELTEGAAFHEDLQVAVAAKLKMRSWHEIPTAHTNCIFCSGSRAGRKWVKCWLIEERVFN
jgi:GAF domain-containing protein